MTGLHSTTTMKLTMNLRSLIAFNINKKQTKLVTSLLRSCFYIVFTFKHNQIQPEVLQSANDIKKLFDFALRNA